MSKTRIFFLLAVFLTASSEVVAQAEVIELTCPSCGYRQRFIQGADTLDETRNVQRIIVVCERSAEIRNITIPLDPRAPVQQEPLLARQHGTGTSRLLGVELPKFLVPAHLPLFSRHRYLEANVCPMTVARHSLRCCKSILTGHGIIPIRFQKSDFGGNFFVKKFPPPLQETLLLSGLPVS